MMHRRSKSLKVKIQTDVREKLTWRWDFVTEEAHFIASLRISPQRAAKSFTILYRKKCKQDVTLD